MNPDRILKGGPSHVDTFDYKPTMGDWFRAAGYRTHYRGKWHLSDSDLPGPGPGHHGLPTNDRDGELLALFESLGLPDRDKGVGTIYEDAVHDALANRRIAGSPRECARLTSRSF